MRAEARSGSVSAAQATVATIPAHGEDLVEYSKIRSLGDCPVAKTLWASIQAGKVKTPSGEPNGAGADVSVAGGEGPDGAGGGSKFARAEHTKRVTPGCDRPKPPAAAPAVCDVYIVQVVCMCMHTHTHTHTHAYIHACIHTYVRRLHCAGCG